MFKGISQILSLTCLTQVPASVLGQRRTHQDMAPRMVVIPHLMDIQTVRMMIRSQNFWELYFQTKPYFFNVDIEHLECWRRNAQKRNFLIVFDGCFVSVPLDPYAMPCTSEFLSHAWCIQGERCAGKRLLGFFRWFFHVGIHVDPPKSLNEPHFSDFSSDAAECALQLCRALCENVLLARLSNGLPWYPTGSTMLIMIA